MLQKLISLKWASLSDSTSAFTLPKVIFVLCYRSSAYPPLFTCAAGGGRGVGAGVAERGLSLVLYRQRASTHDRGAVCTGVYRGDGDLRPQNATAGAPAA